MDAKKYANIMKAPTIQGAIRMNEDCKLCPDCNLTVIWDWWARCEPCFIKLEEEEEEWEMEVDRLLENCSLIELNMILDKILDIIPEESRGEE